MPDYASNSIKNKAKGGSDTPEKPKVERVVTGEVVTRDKPLTKKFKDVFFSGDFKSSMRYVLTDILLPAGRNTLSDAGKSIVDRMIFGERAAPRRQNVDYGRFSTGRSVHPMHNRPYLPDQPPRPSLRTTSRGFDDIVLSSKNEAELVIERLGDIVSQYEVASLVDLYDLVGLPSAHTDNKWGWTTMVGSAVRQVREGFLLELPPLEAI